MARKKVKKVVKKVNRAVKKTKKTKAKVIRVVKGKKGKTNKGANSVYLSLGSNVGDREEYIEQAVFLLGKTKGVEVSKRSSNYESQAEGGPNQPAFMNAAIEIKTRIPPHKLLEIIQETEEVLGREREVEWGPRPIDIDILFYGDEVISDDNLQIPHPLLHERIFVLKPLTEIAPHLMHPVLEKDVEALYEERKSEVGDKYDDDLPGFRDIKSGYTDDYERW
jgi:2-amino-4-hydroxy-6-hydroxymethyldihydropteridine diphosphokinase